MNTFVMCATSTGLVVSQILCERIPIKGLITLNDDAIGKPNEYYDFKSFCNNHHIQYIGLNSYGISSQEDVAELSAMEIDLIIVASWQRLVPEWLINRCSIGIIGSHGSPEGITLGRGRSPQNWALLLGCNHFNISIFWIASGIDNGAVIDSRQYELCETDDIAVSYIKANYYIANMIIENYDGRICRGEGIAQNDDNSQYLPQRTRDDGMIDWNRSANEIYNTIRALSHPYPGAFTVCDGNNFIIYDAKPIDIYDNCYRKPPGTVVFVLDFGFIVSCGTGILYVKECTNIDKIRAGMIFESCDFREQISNVIKRHREKYSTKISHLITDLVNSWK